MSHIGNKSKITVLDLPKPIPVNSMFGQAPGHKRYPSARYKKWQIDATLALRAQSFYRYSERVEILMIFPDKGRYDIDGQPKGVLDLLVKEGILPDDNRAILPLLILTVGDVAGVRVIIGEYGQLPLIVHSGEV